MKMSDDQQLFACKDCGSEDYSNGRCPRCRRVRQYEDVDLEGTMLEALEASAEAGRLRKLTVYIPADGQNAPFAVAEGDRFIDELCWDEFLGFIAHLTTPFVGRGEHYSGMRTEAQQREAWRSMRNRNAGQQKLLEHHTEGAGTS